MTKWEYFDINSDNVHTIQGIETRTLFDQLGSHGWELITVIVYTAENKIFYKYIFKKQVKS